MFKKSIISLFLIVFIFANILSVSAAPSESYTRADVPGDTTELRLSKEMYTVSQNINAATLGLDNKLDGITDVFSAADGSILLLCGDESRIVRINSDYTFGSEITITDAQGEVVDFTGAQGIYKDKNGEIYIADTSNSRIIVSDENGIINRILNTPESSLIPSDFLYQPISVSKDKQGYTYILSLGCYYGALLYSPQNEFLGFYGANTVQSSALDTLAFLWDKLTSNDVKKSNSVKKLPYSFSDFCFDSEGYMVTITGSTKLNDFGTGQIRKISHNGADILYKRTLTGDSVSASSMNFLESKRYEYGTDQNLVSVAVSDDDYIFALDSTNGTIYLFDSECNLMSAFGGGFGTGEQLGVFKTPISITLHNNSLLVADSTNCSVTVFEPTQYGQLIREAQIMYLKGDYDQAKPIWQEVLSMNRNCQLAYRGMAMVYYNEGNYNAALEAAKIAVDYSVYDMAWSEIISQFISDNFIWIVTIILLLVAIVIYLVMYIKKRKITIIKNPKFFLLLNTPFHPFQSFEDLKYKKLGSYKIAITLTALFYISSVLNATSSGFLYKNVLLKNYNSLFTLGSTVGLIILWSVCNWLVCTMFAGKGSFKEVYVSTTYSLVPMIVFSFVKVVVTNFLPLSIAGLITGLETAMLIYTAFLLIIAMIKVHEYDFFKMLLTSIVTLFFMLLVVFIILMSAILVKQVGSFIFSIYEEIAFR